jgi:hypothetical protein
MAARVVLDPDWQRKVARLGEPALESASAEEATARRPIRWPRLGTSRRTAELTLPNPAARPVRAVAGYRAAGTGRQTGVAANRSHVPYVVPVRRWPLP